MRLVDRYLIRSFISPLIYCVALFSVLYIIIDCFNNLSDLLNHNIRFGVIFTYYFYLFPSLLVQMIPVATLVSILYSLGHLNKHNEILALKASGVSSLRILMPYLCMGILISFSILLVSESIVPQASITSTAIKEGVIEKGKDDLGQRAIENVTLYGSNNRLIYAREYEVLNNTLYDVTILQDSKEQVLKSKLTAKRASYEDGTWRFWEVMKYHLDAKGNIKGEPEYSKKLEIDIPEKPADFVKESSHVGFMSSKALKDYIARLKGSSESLVQKLWVDFHNKLAFPFVSLVVMLIGAPLAMKIERGGAMVGFGTSLIIVLLYFAIDSVCLALGKGGYLPPLVSAWFSNLLFAVMGIYLIRSAA